jgi:beta-galactosidase
MKPLPLRLSLIATLLCAAAAHAADTPPAPRLTLSLDPDWKFIKQDVPDAQNPAFNDSAWSTVSCPHTFNDIDTFDDFSPMGHIGELNQWAGRTWYRKHFTPDASWKNKKIYVEFEGVRQLAEVYLNGVKLGSSNTGFTPFGFDLTPGLKFGQDNILAVMADNTFVKHDGEDPKTTAAQKGATTAEPPKPEVVAVDKNDAALIKDDPNGPNNGKQAPRKQQKVDGVPWNDPHWHPAHGGIYRNVYLHVMDKLHVTLPLYSNLGTEGTYVYAQNITPASADVTVQAEVENDYDTAQEAEVTSDVLDAAGHVVLTVTDKGTLQPGEKHKFIATGTLASPKMWSPDSPNLYTVVTSVKTGGNVVDTYDTPLGIRIAKWTTDHGFFINGDHLKLTGYGQKPTDEWPGLGAAQPDWLHAYTLRLMKDDNSNFVRWGHCAAANAMIEASDQLGIITYQPGCDGENDPSVDVVKNRVDEMWNLRVLAMRDTVIYFRNHPSIFIWEVANKQITGPHIKEITAVVRQWDPSGGRVITMRRPDIKDGKSVDQPYLDIQTGTEGDQELEGLPVVEGEYNREEAPRRVWDNFSPPNFGYAENKEWIKENPKTKPTWNETAEQFAINEVAQYAKIAPEAHSGGAKWIFSDSTSGGRLPVEVARASGVVDGERLPKEAYWTQQVIYSHVPAIHIVGHWNYPAATVKPMYVVASSQEVELMVNGTSLGRVKPTQLKKEKKTDPDTPPFLFTFDKVAFEPGKIEAIGYTDGKDVCRTEIDTAGAPAALKLTPIVGPDGLRATGADVALIDAEVVDAKGERCPTYNGRIDFTTTGPAIWRGGYNSGKEHSTNNTYLDLEDGINRVAVRSTLDPGTVHIAAKVEGLPSAAIDIPSTAIPIHDGMTTALPILITPHTDALSK